MFLDQRSFENEGFDFVVGNNDFHIGDLPDQLISLDAVTEIARAARLEVRTDAIAQVFGFADVNDFPARVFVQIDAGRARNFFELFVESHVFAAWRLCEK